MILKLQWVRASLSGIRYAPTPRSDRHLMQDPGLRNLLRSMRPKPCTAHGRFPADPGVTVPDGNCSASGCTRHLPRDELMHRMAFELAVRFGTCE
jgi:hypothetical protein